MLSEKSFVSAALFTMRGSLSPTRSQSQSRNSVFTTPKPWFVSHLTPAGSTTVSPLCRCWRCCRPDSDPGCDGSQPGNGGRRLRAARAARPCVQSVCSDRRVVRRSVTPPAAQTVHQLKHQHHLQHQLQHQQHRERESCISGTGSRRRTGAL